MVMKKLGRGLVAGLALPWNAFVVTFVYFTVLSASVIGGADFAAPVMVALYLLPVAGYVALLLTRAVHGLAALDIRMPHGRHAVVR